MASTRTDLTGKTCEHKTKSAQFVASHGNHNATLIGRRLVHKFTYDVGTTYGRLMAIEGRDNVSLQYPTVDTVRLCVAFLVTPSSIEDKHAPQWRDGGAANDIQSAQHVERNSHCQQLLGILVRQSHINSAERCCEQPHRQCCELSASYATRERVF